MNRFLLLFLCLTIATFASCDKPNDSQEPNKPKPESVETITIQPISAPLPKQVEAPKPGMVYIPGGKFLMGGDAAEKAGESHSHQTAYPIREVHVDGFWMDATEVTNRSYAEFVEATNYKTFAEKPLPPETIKQLTAAAEQSLKGMQQALNSATGDQKAALLASIERVKEAAKTLDSAGAIVFAKPTGPIYGNDITQWWQIVPGATWRKPDGPNGPSWQDRLDHPVVNVTYDDAAAYAKWAGKRIPTEAEWEKAARGGLERNLYSWGKELFPKGKDVWMANIWQGEWPKNNKMLDGFYATSPVKSFPPNGYGLYDIAGNVWEIVADLYHPQAYQLPSAKVPNPTGPSEQEVGQSRTVLRVTRGGSFLCSDTWCKGYQPGARQPFDNESPANHTGFRCVISVKENN